MAMAAPEQDPRIDDLRQRLRSLGYLDAGVDRFVLGPARATRRPTSIALLASLRIGAIAAILLGPAAAIGLTARLPTLVTGPRDALIVAVYVGLFFGIAVAACALAASLIVSLLTQRARRAGPMLARRVRTLSRTAGIVVALACLGYLTLWWQTVIAGVGWSAPVWTASALAIAVAISLVLGHAVTIGSSAVVLASAGSAGVDSQAALSESPESASSRSGWTATLGAAIVAFGGAALLLTWSSGSHAAPAQPALTVVSSGLKLRVIAIDGFDARLFGELSSTGRLPALASAFTGATVRLESNQGDAADPARMWTTIATGQPPEVHGVHGLETRRLAGVQGSVPAEEGSAIARAIRGATDLVRLTRPAIASGAERRSKTFWEVASSAGLRTAIVNWWATWPATAAAGTVLTDRATLRLEHGGPLDAEIAPPALYDSLRARWSDLKTRAHALAREALGAGPSTTDAAIAGLLERSAELDALQLLLLSEITAKNTDVSVVYLPGLDIAQHALLANEQTPTGGERVAASALADRLEALKSYYAALDRLTAPFLTPSGDEVVLVITGPGRVTTATGGTLAARGNNLRIGTRLDGTTTDVAPTILYLLGVPLARDLPRGPVVDAVVETFLEKYPVRMVPTYGRPSAESASRTGQPLDQEMIERLRSLGYVR